METLEHHFRVSIGGERQREEPVAAFETPVSANA